MSSGYAVRHWPDTTTPMQVTPIDDETYLNEGEVFYPGDGPRPYPQDDPRFHPEVDIPAKRTEMRKACEDAITRSSFQSDALGALHNYDCRLVDQINLQTRLSLTQGSSGTEQIWASDGTRYEWTPHTAVQLLQVMADMNEHIKAAQANLAIKMAAIDLATSKGDLALITW